MKPFVFQLVLLLEVLVLSICKEIADEVTKNSMPANSKITGSLSGTKQELEVARSTGGTDKSEAIENPKRDKKDTPLLQKAGSSIVSFRSVWSHITPFVTILSSMLGLLVVFFLKESPLSPLPVPPLPHSPVGPFPPTGLYPLGIPPPPRKKVPVWYSAVPQTAYGHALGRATNLNFLNFDISPMNFVKRLFMNLKFSDFETWNEKKFENSSKQTIGESY